MTAVNGLDRLEIELRRLPDVSGVGFTDEGGILVIHVQSATASRERLAHLRTETVHRAQAVVDQPIAVELHEAVPTTAQRGDRGRVRLVSVRIEQFTQEMEVHLAHRGVETVGRAIAGKPEEAVGATLKALSELGAATPFRIEAAAAPVAGAEHAVIVILEPEDDGSTRYGVARGRTVEEAAARATLHALNRYLSRLPALSSAS